MANLPLAFAELLGGGVLLAAGISGSSIPDVFAGAITLKSFDAGGTGAAAATGGDQAAASAGGQAPAGSPLGRLGKIIGTPFQGTHTLGNWESDNAVDIAAPIGTPVYAVAAGTIGSQIGPISSSNPAMAGLRVHLAGSGNEYYYAHLSRLVVTAGQRVKEGDLLGYSGSANGVAHLHFAQKTGNPLTWIQKLISDAIRPSGHVAGVAGSVAR